LGENKKAGYVTGFLARREAGRTCWAYPNYWGSLSGRVGISSLLLFYPVEMPYRKQSPTETLVVGSAHQNIAFSILERSKALPTLHARSPYFWTLPNSGCAYL